MAQQTHLFEVGRLGLSSGESRRVDVAVPVEPFEFGGQSYRVPGDLVEARLDVDRTVAGYALRLRFAAALEGPCMRCLEQAGHALEIDAREVDQPGGGEDLSSPYLGEDVLDVAAWAHDALALALPTQIVCREDCAGLCAVCGENLNEAGPEHAHEAEPDPRWAALRELELE